MAAESISVYEELGADQQAETLADVTFEYEQVQAQIAEETDRLHKWKAENERRRHNYVPAIFELLKQLAKKDMLEGLYKDAVKRKEDKKQEGSKVKA
jgi:hypothetical protein